MAERIVHIGFPGISAEETDKGYEGDQEFVPEWMIRLFFELSGYTTKQRHALKRGVKRRLVRLDLSWSVKEHMKSEDAVTKCDPLVKDVLRVAAERKLDRKTARNALIEEGGYELVGLPDEIVSLIDSGRMDVVFFGQDRRVRMNAKREDLRYRSFDLLNLLRLFKSKQDKIRINPIPKYGRVDKRRQNARGVQTFAMRTASTSADEFTNICYVEMPTAEKHGIILVLPAFVVWQLGSIAIGDLAWGQKRFMDAIEMVDAFFDRVKPTKSTKEPNSEQKDDESEGTEEDEDDETPNPDVDMEDENDGKPPSETSATVN